MSVTVIFSDALRYLHECHVTHGLSGLSEVIRCADVNACALLHKAVCEEEG